MKFVVDKKKASPTEDNDGVLTRLGMDVAHRYAKRWITEGVRDLEIERANPELAGLLYDIRADQELAREHAILMPGSKIKKSMPVLALPIRG